MNNQDLLRQFLEYPLWTTGPIFDRFRELPGAVFMEADSEGKQRFVYIEGSRPDKVVLVAHADTVMDERYIPRYHHEEPYEHDVVQDGDFFVARKRTGDRSVLGADDRAGCAILWALKDSGHSLLVTDGEEHGQIGSVWLMEEHQDIADKLNGHQFMIQFDRRNGTDYKCYDVGTDAFRAFVEERFGYVEPNKFATTDIRALCRDICGVNLSVGYYDEHRELERIDVREWEMTLGKARGVLEGEMGRFER